MQREHGVGRVEILSGSLDGAEGVLERLYWQEDVQYADVRLESGERLTIEILRRETAAEPPMWREQGS
jgi:redox-sensitive bicupin YhaK (pirin superfamily)